MSNSSPSRLRRQLFLAIPCAVVAGTAGAFQLSVAGPQKPLAIERVWTYEVALTIDLFGEVSKPVVRTRHGERTTITGVHAGKPWSLDVAISSKFIEEQLNVITRLSSGDEVLASKSVNAVAGQRVVLRAQDDIYAAMVIRSA